MQFIAHEPHSVPCTPHKYSAHRFGRRCTELFYAGLRAYLPRYRVAISTSGMFARLCSLRRQSTREAAVSTAVMQGMLSSTALRRRRTESRRGSRPLALVENT